LPGEEREQGDRRGIQHGRRRHAAAIERHDHEGDERSEEKDVHDEQVDAMPERHSHLREAQQPRGCPFVARHRKRICGRHRRVAHAKFRGHRIAAIGAWHVAGSRLHRM
jgi:hypothetical protein